MTAAGCSRYSAARGRPFRLALPQDDSDDSDDRRQYSGQVLFQRYTAQTRDTVESNEQSINSNVENAASHIHPNELRDCQEEDGLEVRQPPAKKRRKEPAVSANKKWSWRDEHVEALIGYMNDYKSLCDFNGVDFEADLKEMYSAVHRSMACRFPSEFGPEKVTEPSICVKDMSSEEYDLYKKTSEGEKVQIAKAYDRIKSKVKGIRQDYRTAVNKGTRSGCGKIVKEHFDILCEIWGGSPATTMLAEGVDGDSLSVTSENVENEEIDRGVKDSNEGTVILKLTTDDLELLRWG